MSSDKLIILNKRYLSIDIFKGFSIILMVFVNSLRPYNNIPAWSKHAINYGLTYVDLIAPFFIFMLVLNTHLSYNNHLKLEGRKSAIIRHLRRFILFIIIGLIFSIDINSYGIVVRWGTLQILGTSGLILLTVIESKYYVRLFFSIICLVIHQTFLLNGFADTIYEGVEGGIYSVFAWGGMALLFSIISEIIILKKENNYIIILGFTIIALGLIISFIWPISRQYVSVSYVLISVGISTLLFNICYRYLDFLSNDVEISIKGNFLLNLGKNAFFLYLFHIVLLYITYEILAFDAELYVVLIWAICNILIIYIIGYLMDRYKLYLII